MELKRTLSWKDSYLLLFTSIVGSGIFFTTGYVVKSAGHPIAVLFCWFMGGVFALTGALSYAYPAVIFPHAGGDYVYLKKTYSPLLAFLSGWASLTANFTANIAVLALAFAKHLFFIFPDWRQVWFQISIGPVQIYLGSAQLIGLFLIWTFTYLNFRGVKQAVIVQNFISILKICGLLFFIFLGLSIGNYDWSHFSLIQSNLPNPSYPDFEWSEKQIQGILLGIIPVSFAYLGWNMVTYVAEEIKEPSRNIPSTTLYACISVTIIYLLMNFLYLGSATGSELISSSEGVGVSSAILLFGGNAKIVMSLFILLMVFGSLPAMIFGGSRIYYAMARDGLFFFPLSNLHKEHGTPYLALFFQAGYASILLLINDIEKLLYFITCAVMLLSILTALIPIVLKSRNIESDYKIPLYPLPPLLFALGNALVILVLTIQSPENSLIGIGITLLGIPVYLIFRKSFHKKKKIV